MKQNATSLWGEETTKALANFGSAEGRHVLDEDSRPESRDSRTMDAIPRRLIRAYGEVKLAAINALEESEGYFSSKFGAQAPEIIGRAARQVISGAVDDQFPIPMAQGGAGTSFHMNLNEVIASLASEELPGELDPIEDLARYQSTNDTFATAAVIEAFRIAEDAESDAVALQEKLVALETEYDSYLMVGRTEMQDALPMRVGSLYGAWAGAVERDRWRLSKVAERVREVPLGGTALGSGFGAPRKYSHAAERHLRRITGLPLSRSQNMLDAVALKDSFAELSGSLKAAALNLARISADLLYYSSSAVGEFRVPELQYGSSMMPLKTNPVLLERCRGLALSAGMEADKVALYAREGQMQLNAYLPFLIRALMQAAAECRTATGDLLKALEAGRPDTCRMEQNLVRSAAIANALLPLLGYRRLKELQSDIAKKQPTSLADLAVLVSATTGVERTVIDEALSPARLCGPPKEQL